MKKAENIKLSIYSDQRIIIENYGKLMDLNEDLIKVDIYTILGTFLKINQMDSYMIEVIGTISQVIIDE
jgi:hypothetical protein